MTTRLYKTILNKDEREFILDLLGDYVERRDQSKSWEDGERQEKIKIYNRLRNV